MTVEQPRRPAPEGYDSWPAYWQAQAMSWRTEPEIDEQRQAYLAERRAMHPDIEQGIYPFKDVEPKLTRADIEWLLATHESGGVIGPVHWDDPQQWNRDGLDLRAVDLRNVDLSNLPLACMRGGLSFDDWRRATPAQGEAAAALLQGAFLRETHLQRADLAQTYLQGADLRETQLQRANLRWARLQGAFLTKTQVQGATLRYAFFDAATYLNGIVLGDNRHGFVHLVDVRWGGVNLAVVDWTSVSRLGTEQAAREWKPTPESDAGSGQQATWTQLHAFQDAVRANRQLATVLRDQGLNEDADRFAYRAQVLQREVLRRQRELGPWVFSWLLAVLAGYGYRLSRILIAYGLVLIVFAAVYFAVGLPVAPHTTVTTAQAVANAFQVSLTAIHGRVFFEQFGIGSALAWVAAVESVAGIVIEGVFVAMLVQRFFAR
jgi:uncharacterized protein YjbI with pentapeptide repeats